MRLRSPPNRFSIFIRIDDEPAIRINISSSWSTPCEEGRRRLTSNGLRPDDDFVLHRRTHNFAAEVAIRLAGAADADIDAVVLEALEVVGKLAGAQRTYITTFDDDRTVGTSHEWLSSGVTPQRGAIQRIAESRYPFSSEMARRGEVFRVPNLDLAPVEATAERDSFGAFGIKAVLQVPIVVNDDMLGVIGLNHTDPVPDWSELTVDTIELVGRAIGIALNRRSSEQRLRRALTLAERANRAKDELIARAGHELRTPLHAVIGFAEILELDGIDNEALTQIQSSSASLLGMIDDLLELGRLTVSEGIASQRRQVHQILAEVFEDLRAAAKTNSITIVTDPIAESRIVVSPLRVRQVLHCIAAAALSMAGENGTAQFTVCGPDERCLLHLRTSGPNSTAPQGLAFALAQSFIDDLSGTINWKSDSDGGETVTVVELVVDQADSL
jgi:signal transduction histidine kinase